MKPVNIGYADISNIRLYREIHGQGEPLVQIHGGPTTIDEMQGCLQPLAKTRRVIAVEMQGQRNCTSLGHIHATRHAFAKIKYAPKRMLNSPANQNPAVTRAAGT
jgi:hypothetical protein